MEGTRRESSEGGVVVVVSVVLLVELGLPAPALAKESLRALVTASLFWEAVMNILFFL